MKSVELTVTMTVKMPNAFGDQVADKNAIAIKVLEKYLRDKLDRVWGDKLRFPVTNFKVLAVGKDGIL